MTASMVSRDGKPQLRLFLSYSAAQAAIAEPIYMALTTIGHDVFFDRADLPPGDEYNNAILNAIRTSDLFVFLVSPESVAPGAYTRTELRFARDIWPNPVGRVLPVLVGVTNFATIPDYLKAVTILRPEGNVAAEVSIAVCDLAKGWTSKDTIAGKAELIEGTARETERLRRELAISALDRKFSASGQQVDIRRARPMPLWFASIPFCMFGLFGLCSGGFENRFFMVMLIFGILSSCAFLYVIISGNDHTHKRLLQYRRERERIEGGQDTATTDFLRKLEEQ